MLPVSATAWALGAAALWAASAMLHKVLVQRMSVYTVMVLVGGIYAVLLAGVLVWQRRVILSDIKRSFSHSGFGQNAAYVVLVAIVGFLLPYLIYYQLLQKHSVSGITALTYTTPLFVAGISVLLSGKNLPVSVWFGIVAIVLGAVLVSLGEVEPDADA
jgi:drug/metabolite transporter (DMT)-like permease